MSKRTKVLILGGGFSSLSAACYLSKKGFNVSVIEKNDQLGGRAQQFKKNGFLFDMGPSFYWMPGVFNAFFADFGKQTSDYYELIRLDPAYKVFFEDHSSVQIPGSLEAILETFEELEKGSAKKLADFIHQAGENYRIAIEDLVYKPGESLLEIISPKTILRLNLFFTSIKKQVSKNFEHPHLRKILEFPVLFLGAKPGSTPSFYNFMNYADFALGTWYPMGGMYKVVEAMESLCRELGVEIHTGAEVKKINIERGMATSVETPDTSFEGDIILSGADYWHTEALLPGEYRQYPKSYWDSRTFAPSALLFYVAFGTKINNANHHTLFFDTDFDEHASTIYDTNQWPQNPLFYASFPSISDPGIAPPGYEAGTFLIPVAPGLKDDAELRDRYFDSVLRRLETHTGQKLQDHVLFKRSYCVSDFEKDYNSFKGNAYGLANTLLQTHVLRPKLKSKKINNLYFTGQLTVPGPGVPPSIISGQIVSELIQKYHETAI